MRLRPAFMVLWFAVGMVAGVGTPAHAASQPVTCPDNTVVQVEFDVTAGPDAFDVAFTAACAGHMGEEADDQGGGNSGSTGPVGTWVYAGPACDNGGICNSHQMCADGSVKKLYYFLSADGERGELIGYCPGDPDEPTPTITPPTPGEILSAFEKVGLPKAELSIQPPGGQTLVNFETIFSTKADPFTTDKIDLVPGYKVQFDIYPTAFTWKFGDGTELTTDSAGEPWVEGKDVSKLINHVYTSTRPVKASVTVTWGADVRLNDAAPVPVDGTVDVASPEMPLEILEAKPTLVE